MQSMLAQALVGVAALFAQVQAGHFLFEPKVHRPAVAWNTIVQPTPPDVAVENATEVFGGGHPFQHDPFARRRSVRDGPDHGHSHHHHGLGHSHGHLDKRWVTVGSKETALWPNREIRYCFQDAEDKALLGDLVRAGMQLWYTAGLPETFKMTEVSPSECQSKRLDVLLVKYHSNNLLTTPAKPKGVYEPSMTLNDRDDMGMLHVISNIAHEIGHAWGLHHEHQNPHFWARSLGGKDGGNLFTPDNWHCERLADYQDTIDKINGKIAQMNPDYMPELTYGPQREQICTSYGMAKAWGFSASMYLPFPPMEDVLYGATSPADIDWDSIMLYPSGAGGALDGNGNRLQALTKPNGDPIPVNTVPSHRDVKALMDLYSSQSDKADETLIVSKKHRFWNKFIKLRNKHVPDACD